MAWMIKSTASSTSKWQEALIMFGVVFQYACYTLYNGIPAWIPVFNIYIYIYHWNVTMCPMRGCCHQIQKLLKATYL